MTSSSEALSSRSTPGWRPFRPNTGSFATGAYLPLRRRASVARRLDSINAVSVVREAAANLFARVRSAEECTASRLEHDCFGATIVHRCVLDRVTHSSQVLDHVTRQTVCFVQNLIGKPLMMDAR